jgi:hypothetical protein
MSCANLSFIIYIIGSNKSSEWGLCLYFIMGFILNIIIYVMKKYYDNKIDVKEKQKIIVNI